MALKDVIGQDRAVGILLQTLRRDRIPSAYLFAGESGIGKRFSAVNLAKAINCLKDRDETTLRTKEREAGPLTGGSHAKEEDSCDACISCLKINSGTHPDLIMISPEKGEIRVSEIREVEDALSFMPHEGRKKVVIIDEADTMNQSAANAFLKTLEEPPEESLIILIASNPDRLTETIRSRCSRLLFTPLSSAACGEVIKMAGRRQAATKGVADKRVTRDSGADSGLPARVRLSMGRPGLALSADLLKEQERFLGLLRSMTGGLNETWADRDEMERWLEMAGIFMRDMAVLQITGDEGMLFNPDIRGSLSGLGERADMRALVESFDAVNRLKRKLDFNLNKGITWNYTASVLRNIL